uniref:Uncharacterized protein n=1 Tax=Glossina brevipalpis TaxID=37001 RepID=A0A1A9WLI4_9MUSC
MVNTSKYNKQKMFLVTLLELSYTIHLPYNTNLMKFTKATYPLSQQLPGLSNQDNARTIYCYIFKLKAYICLLIDYTFISCTYFITTKNESDKFRTIVCLLYNHVFNLENK